MDAIQLFCCIISTTSATLSLRYFASSVIRAPFVIHLYLKTHKQVPPNKTKHTHKKQKTEQISPKQNCIIVSGKFNVR